jgi:16S rRNA (cytidine1402-2'-O)-methyltransferase
MAGRLILVATPIGNLGDLSPRAKEALGDADLWLVEDTRVSGKLQSAFGIKKPMRVLNEHTSSATIKLYADELELGTTAAIVTDGGSPVISDPGALLVDLAHDRGIEVDGVPGPSAVTQALALSGFFAQRFAFLGFLPRKPGPMKAELAVFVQSPLTLVVFESPFRLDSLLKCAFEALGPRRFAICREMTKAHQQIFREKLPMIPNEGTMPRKGEITVVFEGMRRKEWADRE